MAWGASGAALAFAMMLSVPPALACKLGTLVETQLTPLGDEATVEASINGTPIKLLLDTGSGQTVLLHNAVAKLKLAPHVVEGATYYGVGGMNQAQGVVVREFRIGNAVRRDVDLVVMNDGMTDAPFQGLLGETSVGQADLELDYAGKRLRLIRPQGCSGDQVVYWGGTYGIVDLLPSANDYLLVNVTLDGRKALAIIDSGAAISMVSANTATWAGADATGKDGAPIGPIGGVGRNRVVAYQVRFKTLEIGGEVIRNPKLAVGDMFRGDVQTDVGSHIENQIDGLPDLLIGADFVRAHHIYVARSQGKIYFSYLGGPIFRDRAAAARTEVDNPPLPSPAK